ncbi:unnamed protein product, partial [Polarella glacialis]
ASLFGKVAEDLLSRNADGSQVHELKLARALQGLAHLRAGRTHEASVALSAAFSVGVGLFGSSAEVGNAGVGLRTLQQSITANLATAKVLQGDLAAASSLLESALQEAGDGFLSAEILCSAAYLKMATLDYETAKDHLQQALDMEQDCPTVLLRMGYLLLCQQDFDGAVQFLQKCIRQPAGSLTFSSADMGTAHIYLCIAWHCRAAAQAPNAGCCE